VAEHENSPPPYVYCSEEVRKLAALHLRYSLRQIKSFMFSWSRKSFVFLSLHQLYTLYSRSHNIQQPAASTDSQTYVDLSPYCGTWDESMYVYVRVSPSIAFRGLLVML